MTKVGFVGLGNMGGPMARNLGNAGHALKVFDLDEERTNLAAQSGARATASAAEAVGGVEMAVTMVPEGRHVRAAYLGEDGILASADPGTLLIDSSTIDVATSRAVHEAAAAAGFEMIDAPVSGGTVGGRGGQSHLHVRWQCRGLRQGPAIVGRHGPQHRPRRWPRHGSGGEDLQQHDGGHSNDRGLRGTGSGRTARARSEGPPWHHLHFVGLVMGFPTSPVRRRESCRRRRRAGVIRRASPPP